MGFLDALGGGIQQAAQGVSDTMSEKIKSQIEIDRATALQQMKVDSENAQREAMVKRVGDKESGLINAARVDKVNKSYGEGSALGAADISDEEYAANELTPAEKNRLRIQAMRETGDLSPKEDASLALNEERADREDKKLDAMSLRDELKNSIQEQKLELDSKRLDAMLKGIGAFAKSQGGGATSKLVQDWTFLAGKGWDDKRISEYLHEGKQPVESFETEIVDPATGTKTKVKGAGAPPIGAAKTPGKPLSSFDK